MTDLHRFRQGFRALIEYPTDTGHGGVDVALLRHDLRIACEVSVTTTIEHEVGNARKCLNDKCDLVALINEDVRRRKLLEEAIAEHFLPQDRAKLRCFATDEFVGYVRSLSDPASDSAPNHPRGIRGWRVTRKFTKLTPAEHTAITSAAFELLKQEIKP